MITEADLHAMGQESRTAWLLMKQLCAELGKPYPPSPAKPDTSKRDAMPDTFTERLQ